MKKLENLVATSLMKAIEDLISVPFESSCLSKLRREKQEKQSAKKRVIKKPAKSK
jgi:hypothetical protein